MDKALTFEEWYKPNGDNSLEDCWDSARIGMIPADRAIEIPEVEEWPEDMGTLCIELTDEHGKYWKHLHEIPRPIPAWTPKVGNKVFYSNSCNVTIVDSDITESKLYKTKHFGYVEPERIKPFSPEKIGLPWEEI